MHNAILVHGAWHGSWCWSLVTEQLAGCGISSVAVDLDGHGLKSRSPASRWGRPFDRAHFATERAGGPAITVTSAASTLAEQIKTIGGGAPCVVVAHSMAGIIAGAAAELAPELFARLVYVSAYAPVAGQPGEAYFNAPEATGSLVPSLLAADPAAAGALRIDTGDEARHVAIRETFYGDVDPITAEAAISLLSPDASTGISGENFTATTGRYGAVPHTYVVCMRDNANPVALQRRFIAEIDAVSTAPTAVVELDSSHSPMLSQPAALAAIIAEAR
ncbi:MAG TPA: alpha/beta fold hydrolase [Trebonia sp.]|nr:alpha/beta fold hydrolase [Trebonia sp.]